VVEGTKVPHKRTFQFFDRHRSPLGKQTAMIFVSASGRYSGLTVAQALASGFEPECDIPMNPFKRVPLE
jgi:hypothetical protein